MSSYEKQVKAAIGFLAECVTSKQVINPEKMLEASAILLAAYADIKLERDWMVHNHNIEQSMGDDVV